jgi:hypothetical protein
MVLDLAEKYVWPMFADVLGSAPEVAKERTNYRLGKVPVQFQLVLVPILVPPCHLRPVNPQLYSTLLVIAVFVA